MTVDHTPPVAGQIAVAAVGGLATVGLSLGSVTGGAVAAVGTFMALLGVTQGERRLVGGGAVTAGFGLLVAGVGGSPSLPLLVGSVGTVALWDLGDHAVGLGEQTTADTDATRNVAVHAGATVAAGTVVAAFGFGTYRAAAGGQPVIVLFFLLAGAVGLAVALR